MVTGREPRYIALATDYDGTLAANGLVDADTVAALDRARTAGRKLLLVTGRELSDIQRIFPELDRFDRVVAENGALVYQPATGQTDTLGDPPPPEFVRALRDQGVTPLAAGRVIVATREPHQAAVLATIKRLGLEREVIFNKGAVMVLPTGVNKASGLRVALGELGIDPARLIAVGDAENDHSLLEVGGFAAAVANAVPALRERADWVASRARGAGVTELIDTWLSGQLDRLSTPGRRAG